MRPPEAAREAGPPPERRQMSPGTRRNRIAAVLAVVTAAGLGATLYLGAGTRVLMPGPLSSGHAAITKCIACHTGSGVGTFDWLLGLVTGDPLADSRACLVCHEMPKTAFIAHGAATETLSRSTERLKAFAAKLPAPLSARVQDIAAPGRDLMARELYCATCHQEHRGIASDLARISDEQCRSCHVLQFDSFDGRHPEFDGYPFRRRTRIVFDHAGHFDTHYPEVARKDGARRIPETCASCHDSSADRRIMAVAPFDKTCAACHLDQILGKERASGPKGIAFLSLPGLDLATLRARKAPIGEWPDASEAPLTPFMKVMLGGSARGRGLLAAIDRLELQDLTKANDGDISAVTDLVWEIKRLFHTLMSGNAADALATLEAGGDAAPAASRLADLTASLPRDVIVAAQQQWLPNLATEMASPGQPPAPQPDAPEAASAEPEQASPEAKGQPEGSDIADDSGTEASAGEPEPADQASSPGAAVGNAEDSAASLSDDRLDPPPCSVSVLGVCLVSEERKNSAEATVPVAAAAIAEVERAATRRRPLVLAETGAAVPGAAAAESKDELLFPTPDELSKIDEHRKAAGQGARPKAPTGSGEDSTRVAPAASIPAPSAAAIEADFDAESWADHGGWYRQDYAILYRPVGHKDRFITAWLRLTGPLSATVGPAAAVFDQLTGKGAQGACTKCHSVDEVRGKGRRVNFAPLEVSMKRGRFTRFVHEPHLGIEDARGCLACHALSRGPAEAGGAVAPESGGAAPATIAAARATPAASPNSAIAGSAYLQSYAHGDPRVAASGFGAVRKELCLTCHTAGKARQDCLLCHRYHVNAVTTPTMRTRLPGG